MKPADREKKLTIRISEQARENFPMTEILTEAVPDSIKKNRKSLREKIRRDTL
ncbi:MULTISPECIES: hypothetical protein [Corynebacterium]|uniref:DUF1778 domain-containing protein n=1 Tax=Corynebacterium pseudogenitalium TaxID=38303 RepID=A0ABD4TQF6_9CORY|nr:MULTISPECIES: hypothetical protein [Corynebacterium]MCQ4614568.1 hypothetical protein [Corynebacterium pseudogenitalium]